MLRVNNIDTKPLKKSYNKSANIVKPIDDRRWKKDVQEIFTENNIRNIERANIIRWNSKWEKTEKIRFSDE